MSKVGILGGSFNPIHLGHLIVANWVLEEFSLDKIIFIPCFIQPLKSNKDFAEPIHRLEMIRLAIYDHSKFEVSDFEIHKRKKSYTIDTLRYFKRFYNNLYFIIGADNLKEFHRWKDPDEILKISKLIVVNRGGYNVRIPKKLRRVEIYQCKIPAIEISSTNIRTRIKQNLSIKYLVPDSVEKYIDQNNLYKKLEDK